METWFIIIISLCIAGLIRSVFNAIYSPKNLPPQPFTLPFIGSIVLLRKSFSELKPIIRDLHAKHGPVVSLQFGRRTMVFVSGRSLAHQALIQNSAVFADRPPALTTAKITSCDQHNISAGFYGPTWRALRRNLTAEILHPARVKSYTRARRWVLGILLDRLRSEPGTEVQVVDHFQYTMFCLLVLMCFGDRLEEKQIKQIEEVHREMLLSTRRFTVLNFWPAVGKVLFRRQWEEFHQIRRQQSDVLIPLIRARAESRGKAKEETESNQDHDSVVCYVDTLLNFKLPITNRSLTEPEVEGLCFEFLAGGIDTTATALQWIMANLVKKPSIQSRIFDELKANLGARLGSVIEEEDLHKLPYLKAVVLEGLRRHPPGHFVLPHAVTEDTELGGFLVPKNGTSVNFLVADMGWDPTVWEDPMAFKPDRFLNSDGNEGGFDLTGSREIKMMPFGVGRRMCPGYNLALLHLEYFLANLVWAFEWRAGEGDEVDLAEKQEFTVVMKNPLKAIIRPRMET